jgi:inorganic pyrophosphatase
VIQFGDLMNVWHDIPVGKKVPEQINVIVEIPKGSHNKYEVDKETGLVMLDRVLYSPMFYPADYGFIPQTLGEDNDPLDALVLMNSPTFPATLISARPIGVLKMIDQGEGDDKILCVPVKDPRFADIKDLADIPKHILEEIAHFFVTYKQLEKKSVEIVGWKNADVAHKIILASLDAYKKKYAK